MLPPCRVGGTDSPTSTTAHGLLPASLPFLFLSAPTFFTSLPTSFPRRPESSYLIPLAPRLLHLPPPPLHLLPPPTSSSSVSLFLFAFPKCCSPAAGVGDLTVRAPLRARLLPRTDLARLGHTRTACASFCSRSLHRVRLEPVAPFLRFLPGFPGGSFFPRRLNSHELNSHRTELART